MLSESSKSWLGYRWDFCVLILVLMEYALWDDIDEIIETIEKCLNPCFNGICSLRQFVGYDTAELLKVLILVLMEYALWAEGTGRTPRLPRSLNPCFNGICSLRRGLSRTTGQSCCLNPCFNGICSLRKAADITSPYRAWVLILVLMEYALWGCSQVQQRRNSWSLNPCFNGICSLS